MWRISYQGIAARIAANNIQDRLAGSLYLDGKFALCPYPPVDVEMARAAVPTKLIWRRYFWRIV